MKKDLERLDVLVDKVPLLDEDSGTTKGIKKGVGVIQVDAVDLKR